MGLNKRLSIAIVTPHLHATGGVEQVNDLLCQTLNEKGIVLKFFTKDAVKYNLPNRIIRKLFGLHHLIGKQFNHMMANTVDLVICNGEYGYGIKHPKAIVCFHGCYYGYREAMRPCINLKQYAGLTQLTRDQKISARGKYVVAVSLDTANALTRQGVSVNAIIENAVNTEIFKPEKGVKKIDRCLFVGSSDYYGKGWDCLIELASKGIKIDCITDKKPPDIMGWLGNIPNRRLPDFYNHYKTLLLPSRFEGCPMVVLEAMACGMPVLISNVGIGTDLKKEIPAFVADGPREIMASIMIDKIQQIESNYNTLSTLALEYVLKKHNYNKWQSKWLNVINTVAH